MLVVEGPDGAGKTTLVHRLAAELGWPVAPRVVKADTTTLEGQSLKLWVEETNQLGFHKMIYDRHRLISEPIYGPVFRGNLSDGFDDMAWFSDQWHRFLDIKPFIVMCLPPLETVMRNLRDDEENIVVRDKIPLVYWQYWTLLARLKWPCVWWNFEDGDQMFHALVNLITREAEYHEL